MGKTPVSTGSWGALSREGTFPTETPRHDALWPRRLPRTPPFCPQPPDKRVSLSLFLHSNTNDPSTCRLLLPSIAPAHAPRPPRCCQGGGGGKRWEPPWEMGRSESLHRLRRCCTGSVGSEVLFFNINFNDSAEELPPKLFSQFLTRHLRMLVDGLHMNFENFAASVL